MTVAKVPVSISILTFFRLLLRLRTSASRRHYPLYTSRIHALRIRSIRSRGNRYGATSALVDPTFCFLLAWAWLVVVAGLRSPSGTLLEDDLWFHSCCKCTLGTGIPFSNDWVFRSSHTSILDSLLVISRLLRTAGYGPLSLPLLVCRFIPSFLPFVYLL